MDVIKKKHWWQSDALKWSVLGLLGLLVGYLVVLMYAQGEYLFAITTLILSSAGLYIFANRKAYAWRYVYPGMAGMGLFVLFPLVCTIAIAFTNYSSTNQLTFERAQEVLLDRSWQAGKTYNFGLYPAGDEWQLALSDGETGKNYLSDAFKFGGEQKLQLKETAAQPEGERANLRVITQNRQALSDITAILPDGNKVMMSSLRQFSGTQPLYTLDGAGTLTNNQSGVKYRPNNQIGFYQSITADGNWGDEKPRLHRDHRLEKLYPRLHRRRHSETVPRHFRLDRGVLADHCLFNGGGRHGSGVSGAVGSVARQSGLSRPADSALRGAIVHFNLDFQRVV